MFLNYFQSAFSNIQSGFYLFALLFLLTACDSPEATKPVDFSRLSASDTEVIKTQETQSTDETFNFGFDLRSSIEEDLRQYQPLITYLSGATGYHFDLIIALEDDNLNEMLGRGDVHFAAVGAVTHIKTQESYSAIPLVRGINNAGKAEYRSVIVTHPNSAVQSIAELRGKRLAFGSQSSTQGYLIPRIDLQTQGIGLGDLKEFQFTGSHRNCADAVISGRVDVCGMQDTMGEDLQDQGLLRIVHWSDYYPSSGISASPDVSPEVIHKVQQALIDFEPQGRHSAMLYDWDKTEMPNGFKKAARNDYDVLREWMKRFGLLPETDKE